MNDPGKFTALLRRFSEKKIILPIRGGLPISWTELHAVIFFICCVICSCCSLSSYLFGNAGLHPAAPTPTLRPDRSQTATLTPIATATVTHTPTPSPSPSSTPPPAPTTPTPTPPPTATSPAPQPTPTAAPTGSPAPTNTPQAATSAPTNTPQPTHTPTPIPSDLHIASVDPGTSLDDEYVLIENRGAGSQNMSGWTLSDDNFNTYFFPVGFILGGGASVYVWTKSGTDTTTELYWGRGDPAWGIQDTAILRDNAALVIDSLSW